MLKFCKSDQGGGRGFFYSGSYSNRRVILDQERGLYIGDVFDSYIPQYRRLFKMDAEYPAHEYPATFTSSKSPEVVTLARSFSARSNTSPFLTRVTVLPFEIRIDTSVAAAHEVNSRKAAAALKSNVNPSR